jgi:hypothetical protein
MSPALLGWWHDTAELNVYRPYLVAGTRSAGSSLDSPAPEEHSSSTG